MMAEAGLCLALDAKIHTTKRLIEADEFFKGMFETALQDGEIIKAAQIDGAPMTSIYRRIIIPMLRPVFLSAFIVLAHMAIKAYDLVIALNAHFINPSVIDAGRDLLIRRRTRQQVARDLLDRKLVERHVPVERVDHPIAPRPHPAFAVHLKPVAVRVARDV